MLALDWIGRLAVRLAAVRRYHQVIGLARCTQLPSPAGRWCGSTRELLPQQCPVEVDAQSSAPLPRRRPNQGLGSGNEGNGRSGSFAMRSHGGREGSTRSAQILTQISRAQDQCAPSAGGIPSLPHEREDITPLRRGMPPKSTLVGGVCGDLGSRMGRRPISAAGVRLTVPTQCVA